MNCLPNPAARGNYNQLTYGVSGVMSYVEIDHIPDPRIEAEHHYYNAKHSKLVDLGL